MESSPSSTPFWKSSWFPYIALTIVWAIVYAVTFDDKIDLGGDNAVYYILGDSLSDGQGYTNVHEVGGRPNNHFPPGYPLILAFFMTFSKSISFLKFVSGLFFLGTVLLSYRIFKRIVDSNVLAFVLGIFIIFNGNIISSGNIMMSEIPFLFFSTLTIHLFMLSESRYNFLKDWRFWTMVLVAAFSYHIRTAGIALIAGFLIYLAVNRKWLKAAAFGGGFALLSLPWILRGKALGGSNYINQLLQINPYRREDGMLGFGDLITRLMYNIERYVSVELPRTFFTSLDVNYTMYMRHLTGSTDLPPNYTPETHWFLGIVLIALIIYGVYSLKNYRSFVAFYLLGSAGILLLWPYVWFGTRFILPLIPFLILGVVSGVDALIKRFNKGKGANPLLYLTLVLTLIPSVKQEAEKVDYQYPGKYADFLSMSRFVNDNLPPDAVVLNRKPGLFYLYGNRKSINIPSTLNYAEMQQAMDSAGVTHVIVDAMGFADVGRYLIPFMQNNEIKFTGIQQIQTTSQYPTQLFAYNSKPGYTGDWVTIETENGTVNERTGKGVYRFSDGRIFDGHWKKGLRHGEGVMQFTNGSKLRCTWDNDTIAGSAELIDANNQVILSGNYSEEEFIEAMK